MKINKIIILLILFSNFLHCQRPPDKPDGKPGGNTPPKRDDPKDKVKEQCKTYGQNNKVRKFEECNTYSNSTEELICCYITGINPNKTSYNGCIAINSMFANQSLSYESNKFSGKLICVNNYSFQKIIKIHVIIYVLSFFFQFL